MVRLRSHTPLQRRWPPAEQGPACSAPVSAMALTARAGWEMCRTSCGSVLPPHPLHPSSEGPTEQLMSLQGRQVSLTA